MGVWYRRQKNRLGYKIRMLKINKFLLFLMLLLVFSILFISYYVANIRPMVGEMAKNQVTQAIEVTVNNAILKNLNEQSVTYDNLVIIDKNENGEITAIKANSVLMNLVKASVANLVIDEIKNMDSSKVGLPVGNVISSEFLSGRGPKIPVKAVPYGTCTVQFESNFSQAGINQTKLQLNMNVNTKIAILLPVGNGTTYTEINSSFPLGETVIVGKVPDTYANFDQSSRPEDASQFLNPTQ